MSSSSSPTSSPFLSDSSPPNSPFLQPLALDEGSHFSQPHPLAASFKANRKPPSYETGVQRSKTTWHQKKMPYTPWQPNKHRRDNVEVHPPLNLAIAGKLDVIKPEDDELVTWDLAVERAMLTGSKNVDLCNRNLTMIPKKFVADLEKVVVLPGSDRNAAGDLFANGIPALPALQRTKQFSRSHTAPELVIGNRTQTERMRSVASVSLTHGMSRDEVQLFLANNSITYLPKELWNLQTLTVLSLRGNCISYLPPEIVQLKNLRSLNIGNNKLNFLPAEINNMKLETLSLQPNPFLEPPTSQPYNRPVSDIRALYNHQVPTLTELLLRILVSTSVPPLVPTRDAPKPPETMLATLYDLPLPEYVRNELPLCIREALEVCVPTSIGEVLLGDQTRGSKQEAVTGIGVCLGGSHLQGGRVFVRHMEERFSWEVSIAGQRAGGLVPIRWRGCQKGCLDILPGSLCRDAAKMEVVDEDIVQTLELGGDELDFDE